MNLLIAENDFVLVGVLKPRFEAEDYAVDLARNTEQSMSMLRSREYHAAIVDLDLPSTEGLAILQFARAACQDLPILILGQPRGSGRARPRARLRRG
jgi:DNA-binding response OmpR family regulator